MSASAMVTQNARSENQFLPLKLYCATVANAGIGSLSIYLYHMLVNLNEMVWSKLHEILSFFLQKEKEKENKINKQKQKTKQNKTKNPKKKQNKTKQKQKKKQQTNKQKKQGYL